MAGFGAVKQFKSWSYTRLSDYERCPAFANYKHLLKLPEPKGAAMQRGADIAQATEDWFKGTRRTMPTELKPLGDVYKILKKDKTVQAEANWGFTKDWEPCSSTDWNRCWLRMKIDILTVEGADKQNLNAKTLNLYDSKTGKYNAYAVAGYEDQLNLYATGGVVMFPTVQDINVRLLFSDLGIMHPRAEPKVYTNKEAQAQRKVWERRVKPMFNDTRFTPKPGPYCSWCPFSKNYKDRETGVPIPGPCKY